MTTPAAAFEAAPHRYARIGGALYLGIILLGGFAEGYASNTLVVPGDAMATARNVLASPGLWQLSVAANLAVVMLAVPLTWIEYLLLRPAGRQLALLSLLSATVSLAVEAISKLYLFMVLPTLGAGGDLAPFAAGEREALAYLALLAHDVSFNLALVFFGFACLTDGLLIRRSGYLPKAVGWLMQAAGAGYLVACLAALCLPALADIVLPTILLVPLVGESSFCLWLLLKGVDAGRFEARAAAAGLNRPAAPG